MEKLRKVIALHANDQCGRNAIADTLTAIIEEMKADESAYRQDDYGITANAMRAFYRDLERLHSELLQQQ